MNNQVTIISSMQTGKIFDKTGKPEYHWVKPARTLTIAVGASFDLDLIKWCENTFGPQLSDADQSGRWFYKSHKFYFMDEKDLTMFILSFE